MRDPSSPTHSFSARRSTISELKFLVLPTPQLLSPRGFIRPLRTMRGKSRTLSQRTLLKLLRLQFILSPRLRAGYIILPISFRMVVSATPIPRIFLRTLTQKLSRSKLKPRIPMRRDLSLSLSTERSKLEAQPRLPDKLLGSSA